MMRRNWILPLGLAATTALGALTLPALSHEFQRDDWRGQGYCPMGESGEWRGEGYGPMGEQGGWRGEGYGPRGEQGRDFDAHHGMFDAMRQMHRGMDPGFGPGMMGGFGQSAGIGPMGGFGVMGGMGPPDGMEHMGGVMQAFDADGDGSLTADEMRSGLEDRLAEFDADDSGSLSIDEFEALHSAMIREAMVDRFQALDNDGDGEVTAEEITAPADRLQRMQDLRTRMQEQRPGPAGPAGAGGPQETMPRRGAGPQGGPMTQGGMMQQDDSDDPSGN
jgi:hypothetical protein